MAGSCFPPSEEFLGWAIDELLCANDNGKAWHFYDDLVRRVDWESDRVESIANVAFFKLCRLENKKVKLMNQSLLFRSTCRRFRLLEYQS